MSELHTETLPLLPLTTGVVLPGMVVTLTIESDEASAAIEAAWSAAMAEGAISEDLGAWQLRCLIHVAAGDVDFHDQAQQAADEIPNAEFISVEEPDHVGAHLAQVDPVLPAVLRTLRSSG